MSLHMLKIKLDFKKKKVSHVNNTCFLNPIAPYRPIASNTSGLPQKSKFSSPCSPFDHFDRFTCIYRTEDTYNFYNTRGMFVYYRRKSSVTTTFLDIPFVSIKHNQICTMNQ